MEQEKIDWTLDVISRLLQKGIGDPNRIKNIKYNVENNFEVSKKDSEYLKKQFETLENFEKQEKLKVCARCNKNLGIIKHDSLEYMDYVGKLCGDCLKHMRENTLSAAGKYIEGTLDIKPGADIKIYCNNFDEGSLAINSKKKFNFFPIEGVKTVHLVFREESSFKKKILSAGHQDKQTAELLEIKLDDDGVNERIVLKTKNVESVMEEINKLQKRSKARGYREEISEPTLPQKETPRTSLYKNMEI